MQRIVVDVQTGEQTIVQLTPEEIAELQNIPVTVTIPDISDRQFFQQAAVLGIITKTEALAAVQTGTMPPNLQTVIDGIVDENERFAVSMVLTGATTFQRNHPLTNSIGVALGLTESQIDDFFVAASQL